MGTELAIETILARAALEHSETPLLLVDGQKIVRAASQTACALLGVNLTALLNQSLAASSHYFQRRDPTVTAAPKMTLLRVNPESLLAATSYEQRDRNGKTVGWVIRLHETISEQGELIRERVPLLAMLRHHEQRMREIISAPHANIAEEAELNLLQALDELDRQCVRITQLETLMNVQSQEYQFQPIMTVLQPVIATAQANAISRGVQFNFSLPEQPLNLHCHAETLQSALRELFENIWQHAKACTQINVSVVREDQTVQIHVQDNGSGISNAERNRIGTWMSGKLLDSSPATGKIGLGLLMARAAARAHQGYMRLQSAEGRGCMVTLILSINETAIATAANRRGSPNATILLIEDNRVNQEIMGRTLRTMGYQVLQAYDGVRGCEIAAEQLPNLIVTDMGLPQMDGWSIARQIRGNPRTQHIPIIALTAHTHPEDRARALDAGCDDYEPKPVHFPRLLGKIDALLDESRAPRRV